MVRGLLGSDSLAWLHHLLCNVVEEVPPAEGKRGLQEGQRDLPHRRVSDELERCVRLQSIIVTYRRTAVIRLYSVEQNLTTFGHF